MKSHLLDKRNPLNAIGIELATSFVVMYSGFTGLGQRESTPRLTTKDKKLLV
jgi:hypothetical protein